MNVIQDPKREVRIFLPYLGNLSHIYKLTRFLTKNLIFFNLQAILTTMNRLKITILLIKTWYLKSYILFMHIRLCAESIHFLACVHREVFRLKLEKVRKELTLSGDQHVVWEDFKILWSESSKFITIKRNFIDQQR